MRNFTLYWFVALLLSSQAWATDNWLYRQQQYSLQMTLSHISRDDTPRGFVVAAPSKSDPNYYFHWVRDAALVMNALDRTLPWEKKRQLLYDYVSMTQQNQNTPTLSDLGEPKFNPDGSGYADEWARPQNDGPALRAISLIQFANQLLDRGDEPYVRQNLYSADENAPTAIKKDLEYTVKVWARPDFDLWEEVHGTHFYTRMAQRTALELGAKLADRLGDHDSAVRFRRSANLIHVALERHWSEKEYKILSTIDRSTDKGLSYKHSNLDASTVLGVLHSWLPGQTFGPLDDRILVTTEKMMKVFSQIYSINHQHDGVGIGRYPEDQFFGGNPWFLLTIGFAEYFLKVSTALAQDAKVTVSGTNKPFYVRILGRDILPGKYDRHSQEFLDIRRGLRSEAEAYLRRVQFHAGEGGRMDEQFDRNNGFMKGAFHLTWSYASYLTFHLQYTTSNSF